MSHFLVVDDSAVDRTLAGGLLEQYTKHHVEYASNGVEALELLEARLPLAVLTDLRMPEMDGMQLIETMHRQFPTVPVIVMTAHGSEEVALRALMSGAADYIPKSELASQLTKLVDALLAITGRQLPGPRISQCLRYEELMYELENDVLLIPPIVEQLQQTAGDLALVNRADGVRLAKALAEALRNAIYHGNLELSANEVESAANPSSPAARMLIRRREQTPYCDRRVQLQAIFSLREARFAIRDEGPGFDTSRLPDVKADPSYLSRRGGRGLVLIHAFMDEVRFNPAGNEITLVKRARSAPLGSEPSRTQRANAASKHAKARSPQHAPPPATKG